MAQTAAKLIIEPIFEAELEPDAYGYRPKRSAQDAVEKVDELLHLIGMWLKVPVEERDEKGKKRLTGGKDNDRGTPQGGEISPMGGRSSFAPRMVTYADDFVILSRGKAAESLEWTRGVLGRLKLTLNEKKTSVRDARRERFDFLGYTFGPHYSGRTGREYLGRSPSKKSVNKMKRNVGEHLSPGNHRPWEEVRDRLNRKLRGWKAYFGLGSTARAYRAVDEYVEERVRHFLRRRHKVSSQGTRQFSMKQVYGPLGVYRLRGPLRVAAS